MIVIVVILYIKLVKKGESTEGFWVIITITVACVITRSTMAWSLVQLPWSGPLELP